MNQNKFEVFNQVIHFNCIFEPKKTIMLRFIHQKSYLLATFYWVIFTVFLTMPLVQNIAFNIDKKFVFAQIDAQNEGETSESTNEYADETDFELTLSQHHLATDMFLFIEQTKQNSIKVKFPLSSISKDITSPPPQI
jgi:hypothetical protein